MQELTKEYFDQQIGKLALKEDLLALKVDFIDLKTDVTSLQTDTRSLKRQLSGMEETLNRIDKRDKEDSNAFAKDIVQLQKDVKVLKLKQIS